MCPAIKPLTVKTAVCLRIMNNTGISVLPGLGTLCAASADGPRAAVYLPGESSRDEVESLLAGLSKNAGDKLLRPFVLVCPLNAGDWNDVFSPWPAPALNKKSAPFTGGAVKTLVRLRDEIMPAVAAGFDVPADREHNMIMGYSLAGLFALWAFLETGIFGSCASCSGSLWYDGFTDRLPEYRTPPHSRVYLSLGSREENAGPERMRAVGDATRRTNAFLSADPHVDETVLVMNDGGHFNDISGRLSRALIWLLAVNQGTGSCPAKGDYLC